MNINKHWPRWIHVSAHKHFSDALSGSAPFFIAGQHRGTRDDKTLVELRIGGPDFAEVSRNDFEAVLTVNLLLQVAMNDSDYHEMLKLEGLAASFFSDFQIYRYGDIAEDAENDGSLLGCVKLQDEIMMKQFPITGKEVKLQQSYIIADYTMCLSN